MFVAQASRPELGSQHPHAHLQPSGKGGKGQEGTAAFWPAGLSEKHSVILHFREVRWRVTANGADLLSDWSLQEHAWARTPASTHVHMQIPDTQKLKTDM